MLLDKITLKNFRQFYKEQTIEFAKSTNRNITVIHGENGSGKTALLNAFSWCFYGKTDLPNPKELINEQAMNEASANQGVECYVLITFSDHGKMYSLKRKLIGHKDSYGNIIYGNAEAELEYKRNGNSEVILNPTDEINRIIPENLRTYFFFDGERIDNLSKDNNTGEIKTAIKNIMGLEILERSIKHTEDASKKFRSEKKTYGDPQTKHLIEEIERLESRKDALILKKQELIDNVEATKRQMKDVEDKLKIIEGSQKLQEEKEQRDDELTLVETELDKTKKSIMELVSKKGYLAFSYPPVNQADSILSQNASKGYGITGIRSSSFIDDLVERGICICGTEIKEGSIHYEHLIKFKELLPPQNLDSAIIDFKSGIKNVKNDRQKFYEQFKELRVLENKLQNQERKIKEEIKEIKNQLNETDSEEITSLMAKMGKLENTKTKLDREIGRIDLESEQIEEELRDKDNEQKKNSSREEKAQLAQKRVDACLNLIETMESIYKIREKIVKELLQERITTVYRQFLRKGYKVELSPEYKLNVLNQNKNKVGMSQGERQITSLSFIGAIVDLAREQFNKEANNSFEDGGIYPLVMDSPFGALDSDHRDRIAKGIHKLADQIVVIVSTSQWHGEVEGQMRDLIGKEYRLQYNDPRINKDQPYEFTEAIEVRL